ATPAELENPARSAEADPGQLAVERHVRAPPAVLVIVERRVGIGLARPRGGPARRGAGRTPLPGPPAPRAGHHPHRQPPAQTRRGSEPPRPPRYPDSAGPPAYGARGTKSSPRLRLRPPRRRRRRLRGPTSSSSSDGPPRGW